MLTRLRMRGGQGAGRFHVGNRLLDVHTVAGVLALVVWTVFLIAPEDSPVGTLDVRDHRPRPVLDRHRRRAADPGPLAAEPRQARLRGKPGQLVGGAGSLRPRARRHAGRRDPLHLRLPDQRGLSRLVRSSVVAAALLAALVAVPLGVPTTSAATTARRRAARRQRARGPGARQVRPRPADHRLAPGQPADREAQGPDRGADRHHARQRGRAPADPPDAARCPRDPRRRPVAGPGLQPRRVRRAPADATRTASTSTATTPTTGPTSTGTTSRARARRPSRRPGR